MWFVVPKTITIVTSKTTDHHNKYNNNENVRNTQRITKYDTETGSKQMLLEKWHVIDARWASLVEHLPAMQETLVLFLT